MGRHRIQPASVRSVTVTALSAGVATGAAVTLGLVLGQGRPLAAGYVGSVSDSDGDGIGDVAELIRQTDPDAADTDGDGFSDLEELARGMDPTVPDTSAAAEQLTIGLSTTGDGQWVRADVAFYLPDGDYDGLGLEFGAFAPVMGANGIEGLQVPFPVELTLANGSLGFAPGREAGSLVIHFDVLVPQAVFETLGWVPLYATVGPVGVGPTAAAAQTIVYEGEVLLSLESLEASGYATTSQVGGVVARPIEPEDNVPASMSLNQVCVQSASQVGGGGGLIELQVDSSECVEADFLFCSSGCASQVGSSRTIVDPLALIGG